jgi:RadC-like JAB domain/Large polyvalent protein associated domain 22
MADQITGGPFDPNPKTAAGAGPALQPVPRPTPPVAPIIPDGPFATQPPDPLRDQLMAGPAERAARLRELHRKTGVPVPIIERNFDALDRRDRGLSVDVAGLRRRQPELARWLELNGELAPAAADDLPTLEGIARDIDLLGKLRQSWENIEAYTGGALEAVGDLVGNERLEAYGTDVRVRNTAEAASYGPNRTLRQVDDVQSFNQWLVEGFVSQVPQLGISIGGATAGAALGAAFFGVGAVPGAILGGLLGAIPTFILGAGEVQAELKEIDPHASAPGMVFLGGSAIAALDSRLPGKIGSKLVRVFGFKFAEEAAQRTLVSAVKPQFLRGTVKDGITGYATEGFTEALQRAISATAAATGTGTSVDWSTVAWEMFEEGMLGGAVGGGVNAAATVVTHRRELHNFAIAQQNRQRLETLAGQVQASKLAQRTVEGLENLVQHQADASGVSEFFLPIDTFSEYWQTKGDSPDARAEELTGRPGALATARAAGQRHLAVPTSTFIAKIAGGADQSHFGFWKNNFTVDPAIMTVEESATALAASEAAQPAPAADGAAPAVPPVVQVATRILEQAAQGGADRKRAERWAAMWAHRYATRAALLGLDPVALYDEDPLTILVTDAAGTPINVRPRSTKSDDATGISTTDLPPSRAAAGEKRQAAAQRIDAHTTALTQIVVARALKLDPTIDPARLQREVRRRVEMHQEGQQAVEDAGQDPGTLLRAIAGYGGVRAGKTGFGRGEIKDLLDNRDTKDVRDRGTRYANVDTWAGVPGVVNQEGGGLDYDEMFSSLQQDPQFQWITDTNHLISLLDQATRQGTAGAAQQQFYLPGTDELHELGIDLESAWWVDSWLTGESDGNIAEPEGNIDGDVDVEDGFAGGEEGADPDSFEFEQRRQTKTSELITDQELAKAPGQFVAGKLRLSTRVPTSPTAPTADQVLETRLQTVLDGGREATRRFARVVRELPLLTTEERRRSPEAQLEAFVARAADNLRFLWRQAQAAGWAERARRWYVGAHRIAERLAHRGDLTLEQAVGVIAVLSPQQEWFRNVDNAFRVVDIAQWAARTNPVFTPEFFAAYVAREEEAIGTATRGSEDHIRATVDKRRRYVGLRWRELDATGRALLLRQVDEATNPREFHLVTPEGQFGERAASDRTGGEQQGRWNTLKHIANALSIIEDGTALNISRRLGSGHKVRSFYGNIVDPSWSGAVTIDSQAIAAALLVPTATDHPAVTRTMDKPPGIDAAGVKGLNPVFAEAYHRAAAHLSKETGARVLPREVQSVTWEVVRLLFTANQKQNKTLARDVEAVWKEHRRGSIRAHGARTRILTLAGGVGSPSWGTTPQRMAVDQSGLPPRYSPGAVSVPARPGDQAAGTRGARGRLADERARDRRGHPADTRARFTEQVTNARAQRDARKDRGEFYQRTPKTVDTAPGAYATQTVLEPTGTRTVPRTIQTADDAAAAAASMARGAVERFDVFVVNAKGKPLGIVGSFKGRVNQANVHPDVVLAEAIRLEGAAAVWLAHNHPSGDPTLSPDDVAAFQGFRRVFEASGIEVRGALAVGYHGAYQASLADGTLTAGYARSDLPTTTVPIVERTFAAHAKLGQQINGPAAAIAEAPRLSGGEFGVVFLDTRYFPTGFLPMDEDSARNLRAGGLPELLRAASIANASTAVIHAPTGASGPITTSISAANVARALGRQGIEVVDVVAQRNDGSHYSVRSEGGGGPLNQTGEFFQRTPFEGFYSRVARAVQTATQTTATGAQWKGIVKNAGVNLEEFYALALDALNDQNTYTRDELLALIDEHQVDVEVVTLTQGDTYTRADIERRADRLYNAALNERVEELQEEDDSALPYVEVEEGDHGEWQVIMRDPVERGAGTNSIIQDDTVESEQEAEDLANVWREQIEGRRVEDLRDIAAQQLDYSDFEEQAEQALDEETAGERVKYASHVEPGADKGTQREVFLTAPKAGQNPDAVHAARRRIAQTQLESWQAISATAGDTFADTRAYAQKMIAAWSKLLEADDFRFTADGTGFTAVTEADNELLHRERQWVFRDIRNARGSWADGHDEYAHIVNPIVRLRWNTRTSADGTTTMFLEEVQPPHRDEDEGSVDEFGKMPPLFRAHWRELAFKWALRYAALNGYARVAWTTGEQQVQRYSLRKHVEVLQYFPGSQQLAAFKLDMVSRQWRVRPNPGLEPGGREWQIVDQFNETWPATWDTREQAEQAAEGLGGMRRAGPRYEEAFRKYDVTPEQLPRYVGKELAARLLALEPTGDHLVARPFLEHDVTRWRVENERTGEQIGTMTWSTEEDAAREIGRINTRALSSGHGRRHEIVGEQLEVGGLGITALYDKDFRRVVDKLVKKAGGKTALLDVPFGTKDTHYEGPEPTEMQLREIGLGNGHVADGALYALQQMQQGNPFRVALALLPAGTRLQLAERVGGRYTPERDVQAVPGVAITPPLREHLTQDQALYADEGGTLHGAFRPTTKTIRLIAGAEDLSTFLHESGHAFLEELVGDALRVPEGHRLRQDARTAIRWLGFQGTLEEFQALSVDARRDMHEQWAKGFESYLYEGKAPTPELQSLFSLFRGWLITAYNTLRGLKVEVPADVRAVMDRLLASEEAITMAERQASVSPLFGDAASMGVDELTFAAYRDQMQRASDEARRDIDAQVMADWRREQTAAWRAEHDQVRREVLTELTSEPVFVAQSVIRTGHMPDGSMPSFGDGTPMKLSKDAIVQQFGSELLKRLPKPYLYTVTGGHDPAIVAQLTGFPSASALLEALATAPRFESVARHETDTRMRDRHGDRLLDGISLKEAAAAAVSDQRRQVIAAEMRALTSGMADAVIPRTDVVRAAAEAAVARMRYRDVKPGHYRAAAARASQQAFQRLAANDRRGAIQAKQAELVALEYHRAARHAVERGEQIERRMRAFDTSTGIRSRMGKAGVLQQIDAILERYEFRRVTNKQLNRRQSLREFVKQLEDQGLPIEIPADVLDDARQINWRELAVQELEGVADAVEAIAHLGRLKDKLLKAAQQRSFAATALELTTSIRDHNKARSQSHETNLPSQRLGKGWRGYLAEHRKIASLAYELDGFVDGGPMWEAIIRPVNEAADQEAVRNAAANQALLGLFNTAYKGREQAALYDAVYRAELGAPTDPKASMSKMGLLSMAMHQGNETNRQRLRDGRGWTQKQVDQVLDAHLDKRDWDFVQGVLDYIETFWPEIEAKQKRVTGLAPAKVEATPIYTRFGEYRGGYFPLKGDGETSAKIGIQQRSELAELHKLASNVTATTKRNHTKARAEGEIVRPLRLDFGVIFEHVGEVIHDLTHHEMLIDVGRLLRDEGVSQAIIDTHGREVYDQFQAALEAQAIGDQEHAGWRERLLNHIRSGATVSAMAFSATTALVQPFGLTQSFQRVGFRWVARGLRQWFGSPWALRRTVREIHAKSAFMRMRALTMNREINEVRNQIALNDGKLYRFFNGIVRTGTADTASLRGITDSYFAAIAGMQMMVDVPTWIGGYEKAIAAGNDEARAIALADQMVRDSQGSGEPAYLSEVQRGGPFKKLFTNFYSFFNTTLNLSLTAQRRATLTPAGMARLTADYMLLFILPAVGAYALREGLKGELFDDDDDLQDLAGEVLSYHLSTLWLVREFSGLAAGGFGYEGPAGLRPLAQTSKALKDIAEAVWEGDPDKITARTLRTVGSAAGAWFHLPSAQTIRTVEGAVALIEGRTDNPFVLLVGPPRED